MTHNSTQGSTPDGEVRGADGNGLLNRRKIVAIRAETRLWPLISCIVRFVRVGRVKT